MNLASVGLVLPAQGCTSSLSVELVHGAGGIALLQLSSFPLAHLHDMIDIFLAGLKLCCSDEYSCFWVRSCEIWKITSIFTKSYIRFLAR